MSCAELLHMATARHFWWWASFDGEELISTTFTFALTCIIMLLKTCDLGRRRALEQVCQSLSTSDVVRLG